MDVLIHATGARKNDTYISIAYITIYQLSLILLLLILLLLVALLTKIKICIFSGVDDGRIDSSYLNIRNMNTASKRCLARSNLISCLLYSDKSNNRIMHLSVQDVPATSQPFPTYVIKVQVY